MEESEFIATQNLELFVLKDEPSQSIKGAKKVDVKKGEKIPSVFIPLFLLRNRNFIANLEYDNGIPKLTAEQEKKYGVTFQKLEKTPMQVAEIGFTQEKLVQKLNNLKSEKFKEWAEKKYGEDNIDKRKSARNIIIDILNLQESEKR